MADSDPKFRVIAFSARGMSHKSSFSIYGASCKNTNFHRALAAAC
jgi:hypothetical protein